MFWRIAHALEWTLFAAFWSLLLTYSSPPPTDEVENVRAHTRAIEFDYLTWMLDALGVKLQQGAAGLPGYMDHAARKQAVSEYLNVTQRVMEAEAVLTHIYADAQVPDKASASAGVRAELQQLYARQSELAPLAEAVLQDQVSELASEQGLTSLGQPIPSVLYHSSPVPNALIVSRRGQIEQIANISIVADLTLDQQAALEGAVDADLDVSSLVVPIGGVGVYPTMVMRTTSLHWLVSTIVHEWMHNYLTLRPLGLLYDASAELRTMNETTANIVGEEIGSQVMLRYYPEMVRHPLPEVSLVADSFDHPDPGSLPRPAFDFRAEMHTTRVTVDELLAAGNVEQAETYMEERRQLFVRNGYVLRKLNQAYFSFYGSYADVPGGPAGADPVGPAVRQLREQSDSLADFVNRIAWMTGFADLQQAVQGGR